MYSVATYWKILMGLCDLAEQCYVEEPSGLEIFFGKKNWIIYTSIFSVIDIHKVISHATLVRRDLIVYKSMLI